VEQVQRALRTHAALVLLGVQDANHSTGAQSVSELYGVVVSVSPKGHCYIESDDVFYLGLASNVEEDEVGRRFFILNEECTFERAANIKQPNGKPLAVNIKPIGREPVSIEDHTELVTLEQWSGDRGSAKRPYTPNDKLWVRASDIITTGQETLRVGSQLFCKVSAPNKPGQRWQAKEIEICIEEVETDVEQNPAASRS
jgi:hypothetical protein